MKRKSIATELKKPFAVVEIGMFPVILPDFYGVQHNWHKKSIFWELLYWKNLLLRRNLNVMHIEKNFFLRTS